MSFSDYLEVYKKKNLNVKGIGGGQSIEIKIQSEVFLGNICFQQLFIIVMMPLNHVKRKYEG